MILFDDTLRLFWRHLKLLSKTLLIYQFFLTADIKLFQRFNTPIEYKHPFYI